MYHFQETAEKEWLDYVKANNLNTFLILPEWGIYNQKLGHEVWRYGMFEDKKLISIAQVIKIKAKRGHFLFIPHGPYGISNQEELRGWVEFLKKKARSENCLFLRISPILIKSQEHSDWFASLGFRPSPIHMHTELTTIVDLTPPEDDILKKMRKTTRQMIKKAETMKSEGQIQVEFVDKFTPQMHQVYQSTATRGNFTPFSQQNLENEFTVFATSNRCFMLTIKHNKQLLSWGLIIICGKRAFYHQGGNELTKDIPAAYLCHWEAMKKAKSLDCISYDFWGVAEIDKPKHPWAGISLFKRGFGGEDRAVVPAHDLPLSPFYWVIWLFETWRAYKRGFRV